ncbi:uncharacterized protein LOC116305795 [Actinia tenebrosa]|uniref:Uncharacterized protein LOC116305795 n=1 Tax=Actinia tenebrosa TaxID=6105 RepID=A0A6P8IWW3_ACTTE|nr:uncharacterized protein LOC116305795 [Actinia tenebrosa]
MVLVNHVIETTFADSDTVCRIQCYLNNDCVSYNLGPSPAPGMMVCQLNDADRYQHPQDYQERPGYSYRGRKRLFRGSNYELFFAEQGEWLKLNQIPVCTGAKNNSFGTVTIPFNGKVKRLKLVHVSGGVSWSHGSNWAGKWGDTLFNDDLEIHLTDINNTRVAPPTGYPGLHSSGRYYTIENTTVMSPELIFPTFVSRYTLTEGKTLRIWYGDDLYDYMESDNYGQTCADLYGMF